MEAGVELIGRVGDLRRSIRFFRKQTDTFAKGHTFVSRPVSFPRAMCERVWLMLH